LCSLFSCASWWRRRRWACVVWWWLCVGRWRKERPSGRSRIVIVMGGNADSWRATSTLRALLAVSMISTRRHVTHVGDGWQHLMIAGCGIAGALTVRCSALTPAGGQTRQGKTKQALRLGCDENQTAGAHGQEPRTGTSAVVNYLLVQLSWTMGGREGATYSYSCADMCQYFVDKICMLGWHESPAKHAKTP
jgi:hypothetical protein